MRGQEGGATMRGQKGGAARGRREMMMRPTSWCDERTRRQCNEREHNLVVFRVQSESTGKVVAMAVACIEQKSEGWVAGEEAHWIQQLQPATFHIESAAGVLLIACRD